VSVYNATDSRSAARPRTVDEVSRVTAPADPAGRPDDPVAPHRAALVEQALATYREQPELRVVGMVIEPDAPEVEAFRWILPSEFEPWARASSARSPAKSRSGCSAN
jgi:hypothetical protein